jgi:hypothetical protein
MADSVVHRPAMAFGVRRADGYTSLLAVGPGNLHPAPVCAKKVTKLWCSLHAAL